MEKKLVDQADRDAAVEERKRDVIVLAGAGSGKTTLLTARFVERVAPSSDQTQPLPIERIVAVTFTRKAAGELKNRIRFELLSLLETRLTPERKLRVQAALSGLDFAFIGTIHSFADRLLRLRPIEARISPRYLIEEEDHDLILETVHRWVEGARTENLKAQWSDPVHLPKVADLDAALLWVKELLTAGIRRYDSSNDWQTHYGLEGIVRGWIGNRDRPNPIFVQSPFSNETANARLQNLLDALHEVTDDLATGDKDRGARYLLGLIGQVEEAIAASTVPEKIRLLTRVFKKPFPPLKMGKDFPTSCSHGTWNLYKQIAGEGSPKWKNDILDPLATALFSKAALAYPAILSLYDDVKRRHETVDQMDLLIRLRDVLRNHSAVRKDLAELFDHVFVDEFQDTDPVQTDIFMSLCERKGSMTLIGDPKQSIYRFRGADITEFERAVAWLSARGALIAELKINFRSRPGLIQAYNEVFPDFFGEHPDGDSESTFHPETGWVAYGKLEPSPDIQSSAMPALQLLRLKTDGVNADQGRPLEARLAARHIAWLLTQSCPDRVRDLETGKERPIQGKDVAILTRALTHVHLLVRELRDLGVEVHVTGGKEFSSNPLLQRYIFALNAIADRDDGMGTLAFHHFPFSSVSPLDAATNDINDSETPEGALKEWLKGIRKNRHRRPVLHTALEVIEQSLALRVLGLGLNADEDLGMLYRFATILDETARAHQWDFDETAAWARQWIENPPEVSAPARESSKAVKILSIHQSKGLEFPVVYLFDGYSDVGKDRGAGYRVSADGKEWTLSAGDLHAQFNPGHVTPGIDEREASHIAQEQIRLHYVAATRARDFLIVPIGDPPGRYSLYAKVWGGMLESDLAHAHLPVGAEDEAPHLVAYAPRDEWRPVQVQEVAISALPSPTRIAEQGAPSFRATSVTELAHSSAEARPPEITFAGNELESEERRRLRSEGSALGTAVHRTVNLVLNGQLTIEAASKVSLSEAADGVDSKLLQSHARSAIDFLKKSGYLDGTWTVLSELPFALPTSDATGPILLKGIMDLLFVRGTEARIIDLKTDGKDLDEKTRATYFKQLELYAQATRALTSGITVIRTSCLMTSTGREIVS